MAKTGNATGLVTSTPAGIDCGADCTETYPQGQVVVLTAAPDVGARFLGWTGGGCTGTGPCTLSLTASVTVTAAFALEHTLVVTRAGSGSGVVTSTPAGIDCGMDCNETYLAGAVVTLIATPNAGSTFAGWSMGCTGTNPCTVTINTATMVTATFTQQFPLTVVLTGTGAGSVISNPAGINCGSACTSSFDSGTQVTLTATAAMGSTFTGWSGGGCSGTGTCVTTVTAAGAVVASFTQLVPLTVTRAGTGDGRVLSAPSGIDCGTSCSQSYPSGSTVVLTATPAMGSTFIGWSGSGCSGTAPCAVTLTAAASVTATFELESHPFTVTMTGSGTGTVASSPPGINCGTDCMETWPYGTMVQLVPVPAANSVFSGWSGGCSGMGACIVSVTSPVTVTASFTLAQFALTVSRTGTGTGTVTSAPAGITCGADCSEPYTAGSVVTLTATPAMGSTFAGWSGGGCTGTAACVVSVTSATTVTASFTLAQFALTVSRTGTGTGTVTSAPAGITCGADCSEPYAVGTVVRLTATPAMGSSFTGWSGGGCSGTGACLVTVNTATTVTATFACATGSVTLSYTGAAQSFTVPSCASSISVDARGAAGGSGWNVDGGGSVKGLGGRGGRVQATLTVTPGEVLAVYVGGAGGNATTTPGSGGFNGGGNGANSPFGYSGGGGGGATDLRRGAGTLIDRILVAGGGGSGSGWCTSGVGNGGAGGDLTGGSGQACVSGSGTGGTQTAGGTANGAFGVGGSTGLSGTGSQAGSAGGGGWYGGGAHNGSGGGGGSSYVISPGSSSVTHTQGFQAGDGQLIISW